MQQKCKVLLFASLVLFSLVAACSESKKTGNDGDIVTGDGDISETEEIEWEEGEFASTTGIVEFSFSTEDDCKILEYYSGGDVVIEGTVSSHEVIAPPDSSWSNARSLTIDASLRALCPPGVVTFSYSFPDGYRLPLKVGDKVRMEYDYIDWGVKIVQQIRISRAGALRVIMQSNYCDRPDLDQHITMDYFRKGVFLFGRGNFGQPYLELYSGDDGPAIDGEECFKGHPRVSCGEMCFQYLDVKEEGGNKERTLFSVLPGSGNRFTYYTERYTFVNYLAKHTCGDTWGQSCLPDTESGECREYNGDPDDRVCYSYRLSREE